MCGFKEKRNSFLDTALFAKNDTKDMNCGRISTLGRLGFQLDAFITIFSSALTRQKLSAQ
ncbi:hypothetical protein GWL_37290 [Herbaspirillum sp. GW103]|nr:hypothetical protein GWL_37290 [Herbaspirillum sp. GW103]